MRLRSTLLVLLALPLAACASEAIATTETRTPDGGPEIGDGPGGGDANLGPASDGVAKLAPGVLFVHGSYTLPPLRFCLSDDQARAEPSEEQMAAGNAVGVDVTTARFVPGSRFKETAATSKEVQAYDALVVAALERSKGSLSCAALKTAVDPKSRFPLPVLVGKDQNEALADPTTTPIVIAAEGCETLGTNTFKAKGGRCASPFLPMRAGVGREDQTNAHVATWALPDSVAGSILVHAASGTSYITPDGLSVPVDANVTVDAGSPITRPIAFGETQVVDVDPETLAAETYKLTVTADRTKVGQSAIFETASATQARAFVDPRSSAATYYSKRDRRIAFVLVGATAQRENGSPPVDHAPATERRLQFAAVSLPVVARNQSP